MASRAPLSLAILAFLALLALQPQIPAASGKDPDLPPIDPPDYWRLMTQDPVSTTSRCVGNPKTALCAIETLLACALRADDELCRIAKDLPEVEYAGGRATPGDYTKYRVVAAKRLAGTDIPPWQPHDELWSWKPGDLRIAVLELDCNSGYRPPCGKRNYSVPPTPYVVRKVRDHWRVVDWDIPRY